MHATKETAPLAARLHAPRARADPARGPLARAGRSPDSAVSCVGRDALLALLAGGPRVVPALLVVPGPPARRRGLGAGLRNLPGSGRRRLLALPPLGLLPAPAHPLPGPRDPVLDRGPHRRAGGRSGAGPAGAPGDSPGADSRVLRFLGFYTLLMLVSYSAIPYKTPVVPAGVPARDDPPGRRGRRLPGAGLPGRGDEGPGRRPPAVAAAAHLGWQAFSGSFRFAADPRNPYVYAHTGTDVFEIVGRLEGLARAHPDGLAMPVQIMSRENLWPLPWYLRGFSRVAWWNGVSRDGPERPGDRRDARHGRGAGEEALRPSASRRAGALCEHLRAASRAAPAGSSCAATRPGPFGRTSLRAPRGNPATACDPAMTPRGASLLPRGDGDGVRGPLRARRRGVRRARRPTPPSTSSIGSSGS